MMASTRISVLVNGQPGEFFKVTRGLKQGDPLSPTLFAIAEEVLSANLNEMVRNKKIRPMLVSSKYQSPVHMLFANDIFILSTGRSEECAS